jgi:hypothetical protein
MNKNKFLFILLPFFISACYPTLNTSEDPNSWNTNFFIKGPPYDSLPSNFGRHRGPTIPPRNPKAPPVYDPYYYSGTFHRFPQFGN